MATTAMPCASRSSSTSGVNARAVPNEMPPRYAGDPALSDRGAVQDPERMTDFHARAVRDEKGTHP